MGRYANACERISFSLNGKNLKQNVPAITSAKNKCVFVLKCSKIKTVSQTFELAPIKIINMFLSRGSLSGPDLDIERP